MDLEVREFGQREEKAYGERYLTCAWVLYVGVLNRVRTHEEARGGQ